jgi:TetR/AcrR family transcriptional repressor of nem operon
MPQLGQPRRRAVRFVTVWCYVAAFAPNLQRSRQGSKAHPFVYRLSETFMPGKPAGKLAGATSIGTRERIKRVTTELIIRHGFRGTNFRTIAERLATTTTNIHYHFGNKGNLVEEVVRDYVSDASLRQKRIWLDDRVSLRQKLGNAASANHQRHKKFNRGRRTNRPWSLIARLRLEIDVLTSAAVAALGSFTTDVNGYVRAAVDAAAGRGELRPDAPLEHIAILLATIVNSGAVLSQDAGSLEGLDKLFEALDNVIFSSYASSTRPKLTLVGD